MIPYAPPLADIRYLLTRLIGLPRLAALAGYESVTSELAEAVLDEAAKIASEVFAPLNDTGDRQGAKLENGCVIMPSGFKEAYAAFVKGGWNGMPVETEKGGQGLPWCLTMPVQEMLQSVNLALALSTLLNQGAVELLAVHGSESLQKTFLPKMVTGEWSGTMNLTEPQAGSDVGAVRCKAERADTYYRITGQKIFISYGDHDLTSNIIHMVLARLPDAPEGTKGLSLFLVPKYLVNPDGSLGAANDVRTVSIEHKLGQHASPTCVMAYGDNGGAKGFLVGTENGGIAAMFTMMNNARIGVGLQGLGLMERAYQQARDYARSRVQSRDIGRPKEPPVPIIRHPDVKRMLLGMKASTEAARALAYVCAFAIDSSRHAPDTAEKAKSLARVDLLTPVVKAWLTDISNEITSVAIQVYGGMGYIEEAGVAQHMRDARVLGIYEGTNGIQANDLVFRKLARDNGSALQEMTQEIVEFLTDLSRLSGDDFAVMHKYLSQSLAALQESGIWILKQAKTDPVMAAASAAPFLRLMGQTLGGYYLCKTAALAHEDLTTRTGDTRFLSAKIITARFYAEHILSQHGGLHTAIIEGARNTLAYPEEDF